MNDISPSMNQSKSTYNNLLDNDINLESFNDCNINKTEV